jgi:integrase/recombinase XerD
MNHCRERRATYLFESNRLKSFSTRRIRQIIHQYAVEAGIEKRVYPHLFRHQIITYLTPQGHHQPEAPALKRALGGEESRHLP